MLTGNSTVTSESADPAFGVRHARCTYRKRRAGRRLHTGSPRRTRRTASGPCFYLFDGIDHPLRIARPGATTNYFYYELDLAGNVRGLRASGGASLGGYRYSAFGRTLEDSTLISQPLRWKGRWFSPVAGGTYDVRARQWSPELGAFLSIDELQYHDPRSTLWSWGGQNPVRYRDPSGRYAGAALALGPSIVGTFIVLYFLGYLTFGPKACTLAPHRQPQGDPNKCANIEIQTDKYTCCQRECTGNAEPGCVDTCMDQQPSPKPTPEPDPFPQPEPDPFPSNP